MTNDTVVSKAEEQSVNQHCFTARVDIWETEAALFLEAEMPGVNAECVDVRLEDGTLTILGRVPPAEHGKSIVTEYETGNFERAFRISEAIDGNGIAARMRDGILSLTLPKTEVNKPRTIAVTAH